MAHYALLDENNVVVNVIVGKDENDLTDGVANWEEWYGNFTGQKCKRTSYNTRAGQHLSGGVPFRKNYAMIGGTYDEVRDAFIPVKPYDSWVLNEDKCVWESPVPKPNDTTAVYVWDESSTSWVVHSL